MYELCVFTWYIAPKNVTSSKMHINKVMVGPILHFSLSTKKSVKIGKMLVSNPLFDAPKSVCPRDLTWLGAHSHEESEYAGFVS
jgi:hypothetical protein